MKYLILTGGFVLLMASCVQKKEAGTTSEKQLSADTSATISASGMGAELSLDTVSEMAWQLQFSSAGMVTAIPNFYAEIAAPFSGRVVRVFMKLGMKVHPGTPLFEMVSAEFMETQKAFFNAKSEFKKAGLNLRRQQDLRKHEVASAKDVEEAEAAYESSQKEYENAVSALKLYQTDPAKLVLGQGLLIRSPIRGEVIQNELVTGHYLKSDEPPHAKIAELSRVWVTAEVKEKDIRFVHPGNPVEIEVAAYPGRKISGKVYHVEELVNEDTRSIKVLIECKNNDYALKPGMYATVNFSDAPERVVAVPASAVLQADNQNFVFVQHAQGKYERRKVVTGATDKDRIVISSGLDKGEKIITKGGFYLLQAK